MTIRITIYFLAAFNLTITTYVTAQTNMPRNYIPPSPTAANLGLYAAVPVNYYTGVPDISIPLSMVKIKNVDLGINLSYHTNAIRKADEASWVGLGWSLNAGGVITRTKRHKDDLSAHGFYKYTTSNRPCNDDYDQEPDIFFFNFAGRTGKFFIESIAGNIPKIRSLVRDMMKIKTTATGGWEIIDDNGVTYQFEAKEHVKEEYKADKKTETETFVSSWYLTKVTNAYNETISFAYTTTGNKIYKKSSYTTYKMLTSHAPDHLFSIYVMFDGKNGPEQYAELSGARATGSSTSETYTDELVLNRISFSSGSIEFETGDRTDLWLQNHFSYGKCLYKINIKRAVAAGEELFKTYTFNYSYFRSQSSQPAYISSRLQLNGITESAGNITLPSYKLLYNSGIIPDKANTTNFGGFLTDVQAGLLNRIVYPAGGFTMFTYEPNERHIGARIKRIEHKDPDASVGIRIYEYTGGKQLSNSLAINGTEQKSYISGTLNYGGTLSTIDGTLIYKTYMSSDQCMMGESSSDYLVGYDQVTEYLGEAGRFGKCEYVFTNNASPLTFGVPAEVSALNGSLLSKEEFRYDNGVFFSSKKTVREVVEQSMSATTVKRRFQDACSNQYSVRTDWIRLVAETEYNYDNSTHPVVLSKLYQYENADHIYPTTTKTTDSKTNTWQTKYRYPVEKAKEAGGVYTEMVARNMLSAVVEERRLKEEVVLSVVKTNYKLWNANIIAPETQEFKKGTSPSEVRVRFYDYDANGNPLEVSKESDIHTSYVWDYNATYPVAQAVNASSGSVAYTSFETTDANSHSTIRASGITTVDAFTGSRSYNLDDPSLGTEGGLTFNLSSTNRPYMISFWAKGGLPVVQYGNGYSRSATAGSGYQHGAMVNGWSNYIFELQDAHSITILGTGLIDEIRIHPKGAWMNTYTYSPMIGMTGECDKNNQLTRYEYDELGRLQCVRDRDNNTLKTFEYHIKN